MIQEAQLAAKWFAELHQQKMTTNEFRVEHEQYTSRMFWGYHGYLKELEKKS